MQASHESLEYLTEILQGQIQRLATRMSFLQYTVDIELEKSSDQLNASTLFKRLRDVNRQFEQLLVEHEQTKLECENMGRRLKEHVKMNEQIIEILSSSTGTYTN